MITYKESDEAVSEKSGDRIFDLREYNSFLADISVFGFSLHILLVVVDIFVNLLTVFRKQVVISLICRLVDGQLGEPREGSFFIFRKQYFRGG